MNTRILVWDIPTRLFHWSLAGAFLGAFLTAESETWRDLHVQFGYAVIGLIGFRILWGFVGTRYARFRSFWFRPAQVVDYLKSLFSDHPQHYVGHNPAGSWIIYGLLVLGLLSGISGYAVYSDVGGEWFEELHEGVSNIMLALVGVHVAGVVVSSLIHRENLARAMVDGYKRGEPGQGIRHAFAWVGAGLLVGAVALWTGVH